MKNIINSAVHNVNVDTINTLLPFENKAVWIWHVTHKKISYGHWRIILDIDIDDKKIILSRITTNSVMIGYWVGADESEPDTILKDYIGRVAAIEYIIRNNEDTLMEFIESQEREAQQFKDAFNIE